MRISKTTQQEEKQYGKNQCSWSSSGTFALNMIRDFCLTPNLHGNEICFMDIDEKRLDASHSMCVRLAKEFDCELNITKTTSREEALTGADYIINTILINGYKGYDRGLGDRREARLSSWRLPAHSP